MSPIDTKDVRKPSLYTRRAGPLALPLESVQCGPSRQASLTEPRGEKPSRQLVYRSQRWDSCSVQISCSESMCLGPREPDRGMCVHRDGNRHYPHMRAGGSREE